MSIVGPPEARPADGLAVDFVVESDRAQLSAISSGCGTDDCGRTSAPSRPSTKLSPPSTRPSDARGRRSFAFARKDSGRASSSALPHGLSPPSRRPGSCSKPAGIEGLHRARLVGVGWPMSRRSDGRISTSLANIAGQNLSVGFRPLPQTAPGAFYGIKRGRIIIGARAWSWHSTATLIGWPAAVVLNVQHRSNCSYPTTRATRPNGNGKRSGVRR